MRVAVISDIHGNLHALEAVLAAIDGESPDAVWCLGDLVGYGPRPNECCRVVSERADVCLVGNHDLGVLGAIPIHDFSADAAAAVAWTRGTLAPDARAFLSALRSLASVEGQELFHASPRDPVWQYVLGTDAALDALELTSAPLVLVGHSHVPLAFWLDGQGIHGGIASGGTTLDLGDSRWVLNPGSVGQPRDGDPRAAYLMLDLGARSAVFRRVPYAVEVTQRELLGQGLPPVLAERLERGA